MKWTRFSLAMAFGIAGVANWARADERPLLDTSHPKPAVFVGDLDNEVSQASASQDTGAVVGDMPIYPEPPVWPPASPSDVKWVGDSGSAYAADCDALCDSGCDSAFGMADFSLFQNLRPASCSRGWLVGEFQLYFAKSRQSPPLIAAVASNAANPLPLVNNPDVDILFGGPYQVGNNELGEGTDSAANPGFRFDAGFWLDAQRTFGVGSRLYYMPEAEEDFSLTANDGTLNVAVPFLDLRGLNLGLVPPTFENAQAIAVTLGGVRFQDGSVNIRSNLEFLGSEFYGRMNLGRGSGFNVDLLGGYTYQSVEDSLAINTNTIQLGANQLPDPGDTTTTFNDLFDTRNEFNGGHFGMQSQVQKGKWTIDSLFKVHLGNMNQRVTARGTTVRTNPAANFNTGQLVHLTNSGVRERDVFSFAPELNLKLGYQYRTGMLLHVGYSFLYMDRVALAGDQIDRAIDPIGLFEGAGVTGPRPLLNDTGFWFQSIDFGTTLTF